jgi:hypothetical protein
MSAETKGELRERRRMVSRHERRRWDGDDGVEVDGEVGAGNTERRETESVRNGGVEWGRMKPRKLSTNDRERFGGTSRAASRSSDFVPKNLGSEPEVSGSEDGNSSASASGLAELDPSREPVADEHTVGESNELSRLGTTTPTCSTFMMQSNARGGTLACCTLRVALTGWDRSVRST